MSKVRYQRPNQRSRNAPRRNTRPVSAPRRRPNSQWGMKLGAWAHARWRDVQYDSVSRRVFQVMAACVLLGVFFAILTATGFFTTTGALIANKTAGFTRAIGLTAQNIEVLSVSGRTITRGQVAEINAIAGIPDDAIMFGVKPDEIRDRIMVLPWVENVVVRRLWPQNLQIIVTPRKTNALWQDNGTLQYIDPTGKVLGPADPETAKGLPLVIGQNAGSTYVNMMDEIAKRPQLAAHVFAIVRIEDRRWNIKLRNGADVLLPAENYQSSLDGLEFLHQKYRLLDREFARLDVRKPGQIILRPRAEAVADANQNV